MQEGEFDRQPFFYMAYMKVGPSLTSSPTFLCGCSFSNMLPLVEHFVFSGKFFTSRVPLMLKCLHFEDPAGVWTSLPKSAFPLGLQIEQVWEESSFWRQLETKQYHCLLLHVAERMWRAALLRIKHLQQKCAVVLLVQHAQLPHLLTRLPSEITELIPAEMPLSELHARLTDLCERLQKERTPPSMTMPDSAAGETMGTIKRTLARLIHSEVPNILVTGESGTGKEEVATLLQQVLPPGTPFYPINCGAIPPSLVESELFGYEKGAFTGATTRKNGLLAKAHHGWVFLDEITCLPLSAQAALLRTLETGEVRPIGSYLPKKYTIRILAATNENPEALVTQQKFRNDLLQRLRGYEFALPPFRGRSIQEKEDILNHLLLRLHAEAQRPLPMPYQLSAEVRALFLQLEWRQGNIRALWNTLRAMTITSESSLLTFGCLPLSFREQLVARLLDPPSPL